MTQLKIENHNSVALLNRLRIATRATSSRERKAIFNGLLAALKGLDMVESKGKVEGIYEGIDANGNHWFMVDQGQPERQKLEIPSFGIKDWATFDSLAHAIHVALGETGLPAVEIEERIKVIRKTLGRWLADEAVKRLEGEGLRAQHGDNITCTHSQASDINPLIDSKWCNHCGAIQWSKQSEWQVPNGKA